MRLGLTYNLRPEIAPSVGDPIDRYEEYDSEQTVDAIAAALARLGHEVVRLGWGSALLDALLQRPPADRLDGVFNYAEGVGGRGRESQVPATLEMLGIPTTGSGPLALALALDKGLAKVFATGHGIATAPFCLVGANQPLGPVALRYPLFAKPVGEGSSMGIRNTSVCRNLADLTALVTKLQHDYRQPVLVEEFLPGAEYTVGLVGSGEATEVVGVMQVQPRHDEGDFVYSLEVKRDYQNRVVYRMSDELLASGDLSAAKLDAIRELAVAAHRTFACNDFSRVDIREDRDGALNFIEINPIPGLSPITGDIVVLARGHGWEFDRLIARIVEAASRRWEAASRRWEAAGQRWEAASQPWSNPQALTAQ